MRNNKKPSRRQLLTAISAAGVSVASQLPSKWSRPVVDNILLPAHAQVSPSTTSIADPTSSSSTNPPPPQPAQLLCTNGTMDSYSTYSYSGVTVPGFTQYGIVATTYHYTQCQHETGGAASSISVLISTMRTSEIVLAPSDIPSGVSSNSSFTSAPT